MSAMEIFYTATVVAFFAYSVNRELNRPKGPGSAEARWHSIALALIVGGCAVLVYERADGQYGVFSAIGLFILASGSIIDAALYLRRRRTRLKGGAELRVTDPVAKVD